MQKSDRSTVRKQMCTKRAALSAAEKLRAAHGLSKQLELIPEILLDQHFAGYFAVNGEIGLHFWWSRMQLRGQTYYLPRIVDHQNPKQLLGDGVANMQKDDQSPSTLNNLDTPTMLSERPSNYLVKNNSAKLQFAAVNDGDELPPNRFGIPEPLASTTLLNADGLDVILLPLTAFDRQGNRLGMGGGYYDRSLQFLIEQKRPSKPLLVGVGYGFQEVDSIARQAWDIKLDFIATELELIQCFEDAE